MKIEKEGIVFSYNNDQFRKTEYCAKSGDILEWKRNGHKGSVKSPIVGFCNQKTDSVLVMIEDKKRWIKKSSILRVIVPGVKINIPFRASNGSETYRIKSVDINKNQVIVEVEKEINGELWIRMQEWTWNYAVISFNNNRYEYISQR